MLVFAGSATGFFSATPAAAAQLGVGAPAALDDLVFSERIPVERIAQLAKGLAPLTGTRLERMPVVVGRRVEMLTLACRRAELSSGESVSSRFGWAKASCFGGASGSRSVRAFCGAYDAVQAAPTPAQDKELTIESLRTRVGGRQIVRFVWQVDEQGRFAVRPLNLQSWSAVQRTICPGDDFRRCWREASI